MEELLHITSDSPRRFLTRWYGNPDLPITVEPNGTTMPTPLQDWHEFASQWSIPITYLNHPVDHSDLMIDDGKLVFWIENQGCWMWAISLNGEDPTVFDRQPGSDRDEWVPTGEALSEFLLYSTVFEAIMGAPNQIHAENVNEESLAEISSNLASLPLPHWRWPSPDTRILVGSDTLTLVSDSTRSHHNDARRGFDVTIAATAPDPLASPSSFTDLPWKVLTPNEPQESSWDTIPSFLR